MSQLKDIITQKLFYKQFKGDFMKRAGKLFILFLFSFSMLFADAIPLKIVRTYTKSNSSSTSICARVDRYFDATNGIKAKKYIKIIPQDYFNVKLLYDSICIEGLKPQKEYKVTINKNIPLGDLSLDKTYSFTLKTGDLEPYFNFKDKGYILPSKGDISIPIETMNIDKLAVNLYRVNRNNLVGMLNRYGLFRKPYSDELYNIENQDGYLLWKKTLKIKNYKKNVPKTTAIPVGKYLKNLKPGVYILVAMNFNENGKPDMWDNDTQWFMVSDIGLFSAEGQEGLHIFAKHLSNATAYNGVKLELISKNNETLATAVTKNGYAFFKKEFLNGKKGLKPKAIYAYGENGDFTVLDFSRGELDLTDRGVGGRKVHGKYDGFIFSSRSIFKPGESVPFYLLVRDSLGRAVKNLNLSVKLIDPKEKEHKSYAAATDSLGFLKGVFKLGKNSQTGRYKIEIYAGKDKPLAQFSFLLEDFIPPKIEVKVLQKPDIIKPNQEFKIKAVARYLTKDPLKKPKGEYSVILKKSKNPFKKYKNYHFGKVDEEFKNYHAADKNFEGDENGTIVLPIKLQSNTYSSAPVSAYIKISVMEPGGREVSEHFNVFYDDKPGYIGIKPKFEYDSIDLDANAVFDIVYLKNGKAAGKKLHYRLVEEEIEWNWERNEEGEWEYYETYSDYTEVTKGELIVKDKPTQFVLNKLDWGTYRLEISDDDGDISSYRFSVGYDESASKASPDRLPIATDKKEYLPKSEVKVSITPKFSGPVEIFIANSKILERKELKAQKGKKLTASFKIKKEWGSDVYILASAFRAQSKKLGANRAVGVAHISINDPQKIIDLKLTAPKRVKSNTVLKIGLESKKAKNELSYVTVFAVDKGVLNLTGYKTPNPAAYFFGKKSLGVKLRDVYSNLIKAVGEHGEFDVGAGDELANEANKNVTVNQREVVALCSETVKFDSNGKASIKFKIPSFQGTLKIAAVAWSKKRVGSASSETVVKDPISLEAYMPRFLAKGDQSTVTLSAKFDKNIKNGEYIFKIESTGGIKSELGQFKYTYNGKNLIKLIPIKAVKIENGSLKITVYKNSKPVASREFKLAVRSPYPQNYARKIGILDKGDSLIAKNLIDADNWNDIAKLKLKISSTPLIPANSIKEELIEYCCRCAEQTTSRAFPFLDAKTEFDKNIVTSAIERLLYLQKEDGSFGLWRDSKSSKWITAYVLDFLTRAKAKGYDIPAQNIKEGLNWLQNSLDKWGSEHEADAYALYVLARNGKILTSEINYYANNYVDIHTSKPIINSALGWGHIAAALASAGEKKRAKEIFSLAKDNLNKSGYLNYGGSLRDKAALIVLLKEAGFDAMAKTVFVDLALDLKDKKYLSTQEMSQILRAVKAVEIKAAKLNLLVDNKVYNSNKPLVIVSKSADEIPIVTNRADEGVWYSLSFIGTPSVKGFNQAQNNGFEIYKTVYTLNGKKIDPAQIAKNQRVVVVIEGKINDNMFKNPVIIDFLPAGLELENPDISGFDETASLKWLNGLSEKISSSYRDDRFIAALKTPKAGSAFKAAYIARAVTLGDYIYPPALIEDMYKPRYRGVSKINNVRVEIKKEIAPAASEVQNSASSNSENNQTLNGEDYVKLFNYPAGDLSRYSVIELNHLRNGIFAQIGLDFSKTNPSLHKLFSRFKWYKPKISSSSAAFAKLSAMQKKNVLALLNEEKKRCGGSLVLADFYRVKVRKLTEADLKKYSKRDLRILRNSLIARYGLVFKDKELTKIFKEMPWYKPNPNITASEIIDKKMTPLERENLLTILKAEKTR